MSLSGIVLRQFYRQKRQKKIDDDNNCGGKRAFAFPETCHYSPVPTYVISFRTDLSFDCYFLMAVARRDGRPPVN